MPATAPPIPETLHLQEHGHFLQLDYPNGECHRVSAELLRVFSPSAEVRGHGISQAKLQTGKANVHLTDIQAAGLYALKLVFSDGHDSGLYDWAYLYDLAANAEQHWQGYLKQLDAAGASRFPLSSAS